MSKFIIKFIEDRIRLMPNKLGIVYDDLRLRTMVDTEGDAASSIF